MKRFLLAMLLCVAGRVAFGADTDGDGLLDLLDVPGFDPNARGDVFYDGRDIQDLDGANRLTKAQALDLRENQITSIESGAFQGVDNLQTLSLSYNQIASIESGAFQGLTNLETLYLLGNPISELNLTDATLTSLIPCGGSFGFCVDRGAITSLILDHAVLSNGSF